MNHPNEPDVNRKLLPMKATLSENMISGKAAGIGNMDSYNDVIFPGAFGKACLADFLETGFVPDTHNWGSMAELVAMPMVAKEIDDQLYTEAKFHSTDYAQTVRTICMERIEAGKSVGLSIGFILDYSDPESRMWFENGKAMSKYIKDTGLDQTRFDMKGIQACGSMCRGIFNIKKLAEWSPVPIPANPLAVAADVKTFSLDGSLNDLKFKDHSDSVLTAVREYAVRAQDYLKTRHGKDRDLSETRRSEFEAIRDALNAVLEAKAPVSPELLQLRAKAFLLEA